MVMSCWVGGIFIGCTLVSVVFMIPIDAKLDMLVAEEEEEEHFQAENIESDKKQLLRSDLKDEEGLEEVDKEALRLSDVFKLTYIFKWLTVSVILIYGNEQHCITTKYSGMTLF